MRSRILLIAIACTASSLLLPVAAHAAIPFFGPIVPKMIGNTPTNLCPASWGMLINVINNLISFLITIAITFVAPLMIAYSGFLFVWNPVDSGGISKAKKILTNTVEGLVWAFAGWLIVAAVMAALYNANTPLGNGTLGAWAELIGSQGVPPCLIQQGALQTLNQSGGATIRGVSTDGGLYLSLPTNGNCTPTSILNAVAGGPYNLSAAEAQTLSCIAVPESSCGNNTSQARQVNGTPTSASGMFQIVFGSGNDTCHNLNIQACSQAAGVSGNLNCFSAFKGGLPAPGKEAEAAACQRAAANLNCNAQAAACLVRNRQGGFSDWTADSRASTQKNCVTLYANK